MDKIERPSFHPSDLEIGRNDLCYCGSGIKHKKCCIEKTQILKDIIKSFSDNNFSEKVAITPNTLIEKAIKIPYIEYEEMLDAVDKVKS